MACRLTDFDRILPVNSSVARRGGFSAPQKRDNGCRACRKLSRPSLLVDLPAVEGSGQATRDQTSTSRK
jgi:hypothetical protein